MTTTGARRLEEIPLGQIHLSEANPRVSPRDVSGTGRPVQGAGGGPFLANAGAVSQQLDRLEGAAEGLDVVTLAVRGERGHKRRLCHALSAPRVLLLRWLLAQEQEALNGRGVTHDLVRLGLRERPLMARLARLGDELPGEAPAHRHGEAGAADHLRHLQRRQAGLRQALECLPLLDRREVQPVQVLDQADRQLVALGEVGKDDAGERGTAGELGRGEAAGPGDEPVTLLLGDDEQRLQHADGRDRLCQFGPF